MPVACQVSTAQQNAHFSRKISWITLKLPIFVGKRIDMSSKRSDVTPYQSLLAGAVAGGFEAGVTVSRKPHVR